MSRSYKHQPFASICGGASAQYDKTLAARGVRRAHRKVMHIALRTEEYDVTLPHRLQCTHNNVWTWGRDGHQLWQGLTNSDKESCHEAHFEPWSVWYNDPRYKEWPPAWHKEMMRK